MVKVILSIIIILSTAAIGQIIAYKYTQRLKELKYLYLSFQLLETEILYSTSSLPIAMKKVSEKSSKSIKRVFYDVYKILESKMGYSIEEAWDQAIDDNSIYTFLDKEDIEILKDFGKNLGVTDQENQKKNFNLIYLQIQKQQQIAHQLQTKNQKMCKDLGFLIGIAIVIVLI